MEASQPPRRIRLRDSLIIHSALAEVPEPVRNWLRQTKINIPQLNGSATAYTVSATQTSTGCVSSVSTSKVNNTLALPVIVTGATGSTNCTPGKEDGQAQVTTVDGVGAGAAVGYTYSWAGPVAPAFPVNAATNTSNTLQLIKVQGVSGIQLCCDRCQSGQWVPEYGISKCSRFEIVPDTFFVESGQFDL